MRTMNELPSAEYIRDCLEYDPETGVLRWKHRSTHGPQWNAKYVGREAGSVYESNGYLAVTVDYRRYLAHRIAWVITHGEWPDKEIDHKDGNKLNNAIGNLRMSGQSKNCANQGIRSTNTSGFKGVTFDKRRNAWRAQIKKNYRTIIIGRFKDPVRAALAYNEAAKELFGEFAKLNDIPTNDNQQFQVKTCNLTQN